MGGFSLVPVPPELGDVLFFDSYLPHASKPNLTDHPRRILYLTYNAAQDGDHRAGYFADKRSSFPPDVERLPGVEYKFRVWATFPPSSRFEPSVIVNTRDARTR